MFRVCKVVMLPTEKASFLYKRTDLNTLHTGDNVVYNHDPLRVNQHIYITSDDKIRVGDWFLYDSKFICKAELINEAGCYILTHLPNGLEYECNFGNHSKKIIATTDSSLIGIDEISPFKFPQPSEEFIDKFIEAYDSGTLISKVDVEYEEYADCGSSMCKNGCRSEDSSCSGYYLKPIVNTSKNTIKISIPSIKKEFVPYELALRLKQLGFTDRCFGRYFKGELGVSSMYDFKNADDIVNAPTFSQVFRWLRENHDLDGETNRYSPSYGEAKIFGVDLIYLAVINGEVFFPELEGMTLFYSREEAEIACLEKMIETLEQK